MAFTQLGKKLYFNITWAAGATTTAGAAVDKFIPVTPFRVSTTIGDRYGSLLEALPAVTGNSPNLLKRQGGVEAWFVPSDDNVMSSRTTATVGVLIDFVAPTLAAPLPGSGISTNVVPLLPYLSADGSPVTRNRGKDTIYGTLGQSRHFSIRLRRQLGGTGGGVGTTATLSGVLYVQRQHSIEV